MKPKFRRKKQSSNSTDQIKLLESNNFQDYVGIELVVFFLSQKNENAFENSK